MPKYQKSKANLAKANRDGWQGTRLKSVCDRAELRNLNDKTGKESSSKKAQCHLANLPNELMDQIVKELGPSPAHRVFLGLTCRSLYNRFRSDITSIDLSSYVWDWRRSDRTHPQYRRSQKVWELLQDWSGLRNYKFKLDGYETPNGQIVQTLPDVPPIYDGLFFEFEKYEMYDGRLISYDERHLLPNRQRRQAIEFFKMWHPSKRRMVKGFKRQGRHFWAKEMMADYAEWRDMIGF